MVLKKKRRRQALVLRDLIGGKNAGIIRRSRGKDDSQVIPGESLLNKIFEGRSKKGKQGPGMLFYI